MGLRQLRSGKVIDVLDPKADDIDIEDIAHSLSMINRFGGHTPVPYSVAAHSLICSILAEPADYSLDALMHDATEAYLGDVTRPIKSLKEFSAYLEIEKNLHKVIAKKFGFMEEIPDPVKKIDNAMLYIEGLKFFPVKSFDWGIDQFIKGFEHKKEVAEAWLDILTNKKPEDIKILFLHTFKNITK